MLKSAIELAKKDLIVYFRDPVAWLLGFVLPIVMVTIFGFMMGSIWGGSGPAPRVDLYIVDEDRSQASAQFVTALRANEMLRIRPRAEENQLDREKVQQQIVDGSLSHALVIQQGFGAVKQGTIEQGATEQDKPPDARLVLLRDAGRSMEDQIIRIGLLQAFFQVGGGSNWWIGSLRGIFRESGVPEKQLDQWVQQATLMQNVVSGFTFTDENASKSTPVNRDAMQFMSKLLPMETEDFSPPSRPKQATYQIAQSVAGMSVMMLMFGVTSCGRTLIREREHGTMARLLSVGVPRTSLLAGTGLFTVVVGSMQLFVLLCYGELIFRVGVFRDPLTLIILAATWILTASSFGLLIAAFAKSEKQADMLSTILIISMAALGGCWFPLQMLDLPTPFEIVSKSTATYWAMTGFQGMLWHNATLATPRITGAVGVQLIYTTIMSVLAVWLFNRNYVRA